MTHREFGALLAGLSSEALFRRLAARDIPELSSDEAKQLIDTL